MAHFEEHLFCFATSIFDFTTLALLLLLDLFESLALGFLRLGLLFGFLLGALLLQLTLLILRQLSLFNLLFLSDNRLEFGETTGLRALDFLYRLALCIKGHSLGISCFALFLFNILLLLIFLSGVDRFFG